MPYNFGPPQIDFAPLGRLGETYDRSRKVADEAAIAAKREEALAAFGQNSDLAALGQTLLRAGDLEGGMQALRLHAANEGTPFQRARAAAEDARATEADAARRRQEEVAEKRYEESKTRADRPTRITEDATDPVTGMPTKREGLLFPDGTVKWRAPGAPDVGPQSGGPGDENLPPIGGATAAGQIGQPRPGSTAEVGYVIPGTLQGFPHGTVRAPSPVQTADVPATGATETAGAGQPAVAGPMAAPVEAGAVTPPQAPAAPLPPAVAAQKASSVPRRAKREDPLEPETVPFVRWPPPYVDGKAWVAQETKRLQNLAGGEGPTTDMRNKLAKARQVAPLVERELNSLNELVQKHGTEYLPGPAKAKMQSTYTNLLMQLKEMYGLGALQAKDIEMVENLLTDPTSSGWNPFEAAYKGLSQEGVTAAQVEKVKQIVRDGLIEAERNLGGDQTKVPEVSRTTGGSNSYTSKSGVEVKW
jgi:hypothetical protein